MWEPAGKALWLALADTALAPAVAWLGSRPGGERERNLYIIVMCKSKRDIGSSIGMSKGIESPNNQVDASHWSVHLIECSTSSFLIILIAVIVAVWLLKRQRMCCFRGREEVVGSWRPSRMAMEELGPAQNVALANGGFRPI